MSQVTHSRLPRSDRAVIMSAALWALCLLAESAVAQNKDEPRDDLDVTMQIIVDPNAKLPDEIIRRVPLPARKPSAPESPQKSGKELDKPDAASKGQENAREAKELGREMSEQAKERAQEAADQREQARRSQAQERRRNPITPPGPPAKPPRR